MQTTQSINPDRECVMVFFPFYLAKLANLLGPYTVTVIFLVLQSLICLFFILVSTNVGKYNLQDQLGLLGL